LEKEKQTFALWCLANISGGVLLGKSVEIFDSDNFQLSYRFLGVY